MQEFRCLNGSPVQEHGAEAVSSHLYQLDLLAAGGYVEEAITVCSKVEAGHAYGAVVIENQLFQIPLSIADYPRAVFSVMDRM